MSESSQESGGIVANRRDVLRTAGGLAVATALAGALFEVTTDTASAQKGGKTTATGTVNGLDTGTASFPVSSFSFGATNAGSGHVGSGAGAGKVSFQDIHFTKPVDVATVGFFEAIAGGRHLPLAAFVFTSSDGRELAKITLEDVLVTSQQMGATVDGVGTEQVSLNFAKIAVTVQGVTRSSDLRTNETE